MEVCDADYGSVLLYPGLTQEMVGGAVEDEEVADLESHPDSAASGTEGLDW